MKTVASINDIFDTIEAMDIHASWSRAVKKNKKSARDRKAKHEEHLRQLRGGV